jgi:hypothetical protein
MAAKVLDIRPQYQDIGVRIGPGQFRLSKYLSSHCKTIRSTPDYFETIEVELSRDAEWSDCQYSVGSHVACSSVKKLTVTGTCRRCSMFICRSSSASLHFSSQCLMLVPTQTCSLQAPNQEGAILVLPDGEESIDLRNKTVFRDYALRHGLAWYQHTNTTLGREAVWILQVVAGYWL